MSSLWEEPLLDSAASLTTTLTTTPTDEEDEEEEEETRSTHCILGSIPSKCVGRRLISRYKKKLKSFNSFFFRTSFELIWMNIGFRPDSLTVR